MAYIPKQIREDILLLAGGYCEYCQASQEILLEMEFDHILAESLGGKTEFINLCYACVSCNAYKHDFQTGVDPETGMEAELFNPRTQVWHDHFAWSEEQTLLVGLTPTGRATISRLKMNREAVVRARKRWLKADWNPKKD